MNRVTERIHLSVLGCEIELNGERERICLDVLADETGICPAGKKGITINVPFFKKLREIIFFCGTITLRAISRDILRGPRLF
jgi:hypothetical protein